MENHTVRLLEECSTGRKIALNSMKQLQRYTDNTRLRKLLEDYILKHTLLNNESDALLGQEGRKRKEPGPGTVLFSWTTSEIKMMVNREDSQIAKLLMNGCNVGIQTLSAAINQYANASAESFSLADCIIKTEENFMGELKQFR